jgi:hypothetical protein
VKKPRRKLSARLAQKPAITVTRAALGSRKLVYVGCVNKAMRYPWARSRIVYIGRTEVGTGRVAASAASKAKDLLGERGLRVLEFFPVRPERLQSTKSWQHLEADLLLEFRRTYGQLPKCNRRLEAKALSGHFSQTRLKRIITGYS